MASFQLADFAGIIDMDGFMIRKTFYCKELGMIRIGEVAAKSVFFYISICWGDLSVKDKKTCKCVMRKIHKLLFGVPRGVDARSLSAFGSIVADAYRGMWQNERSVIAYKGGQYERDLLASLGIPSINLEKFGCPKAGVLIRRMFWLETCGNHIVNDAYSHCRKVEVEAYAQWVEKQ